MMFPNVTLFTIYNLIMGFVSAVGIVYILYAQGSSIKYRRFLWHLISGFFVFSIGGPLAQIFVPTWVHFVHGVAALLIVFGLYNPVHNDLRKEELAELLFQEPSRIRHPRRWMRPVDERILELFHSTDLVLTPSIIAHNIDYSSKEVNRRLSELADHGFVERVDRGKYRITDLGEQYLRVPIVSDERESDPTGNLTK